MTEPQDIRWKQRFENFSKAVRQLTKFIEKADLNELEQQGLIQSFEYTYELAWNTLKDFFEAMWLPRTSEHDNCTWGVGTPTGWADPKGNLNPSRADTATPLDVDTVPRG